MNGAFVILKKYSPFYEVFPEGRAPVFAFGPEQVDLQGSSEKTGYMLDVNRLTEEQIDRLAAAVAREFHSLTDDVKAFMMAEKRMPIRATQVERAEGMGIDMRMVI